MIQIRRERHSADSTPSFAHGELVRHRRYGYRGVVVELDLACQAPDEWYRANQTQPRKDQPWYHILVDGSQHTTYAAEENLVRDHDPSPIAHPLVGLFFRAFADGAYVRNERSWG